MNRPCEIIAIAADEKRAVCIDKQNKANILSYVYQSTEYLKKLRHIICIILGGYRIAELYQRGYLGSQYSDIGVMKFFDGLTNVIYCKEQKIQALDAFIMIEISDGFQENELNKKDFSVIEKIAKYDYKIEQHQH